jgi:hypothetical protein
MENDGIIGAEIIADSAARTGFSNYGSPYRFDHHGLKIDQTGHS